MDKQPYITLNSNYKIPQFGIGVYQVSSNSECEKCCLTALKLGYRHIDTAHYYGNEEGVGSAIKKSNIPREEIYITTKLMSSDYGTGKTLKEIDNMLKRLNTKYIDLLLLHWPGNHQVEAYKDMEKAVELGKVRSIGLSNYTGHNLDEILKNAKIVPSINQIELHPYYQRNNVVNQCQKLGIKIESWFPIGHGDKNLLNETIFKELGKKYGKSNPQIILRWHIQKGYIIFPKSTKEKHIKENCEIFDFELTEEEMKKIDKMDKNKSLSGWP